MNAILFDAHWDQLLPLTYTRPVAALRVGILTLKEKWEYYLNASCSCKTQPYLSEKFPTHYEADNVLINANIIASGELAAAVVALSQNQALMSGETLIAVRLSESDAKEFSMIEWERTAQIEFEGEISSVVYPEEIFTKNGEEIRNDFELMTKGRKSEVLNESNRVLGAENIFVEKGASVNFATLNASDGPIYIGKDAEIQEGAIVRGPIALCEHSTIKMGAKVYPDSTFGPHCKVAGETSNVVMIGYANKGHDGYLGNAVLGEWCNLGADTNNSNLKNDYTQVKIWDYPTERFRRTGLQFCGTIMGDHSKTGINTMLNTGTVIGVSANVFGAGFPRQFIPSFSWGGAGGFKEYVFKKAIQTAKLVMKRRNIELDEVEERMLMRVFELSAKHRNY